MNLIIDTPHTWNKNIITFHHDSTHCILYAFQWNESLFRIELGKIVFIFQDKAGMGRAYGNIGNAYSAAGFYEQAIKYHKQELTISKEVHDRSSEASTHGNLAVAYQALGAHDMALFHYRAHLGKLFFGTLLYLPFYRSFYIILVFQDE